ncbi:MAG: acyl carrier protein [Bacteroidetes bacterium CG_4_10_14_3_um_filter_31_20]|nr:MAG: acyl carrier protein [Bacteroidetes bacterium CG_4_10_14_3_um_filter_31_20]
MNKLFDEIKEIIRKYAFDKLLVDNANENSRIIADLRINSARVVDIVLDIEEKYNIEIDDKSLEKIITIKDAIDIISSKIK